ncbi:TIGR03773 family transporter-associated surface protein [Kibdelosporangium persicum]|uniref:TIGR03773 family transporter-associated surface protein n=1 Tax=Kibdelosporangium persicum TaxID=2698649 RepID=UPI001563449E|nr:TIGR03773 family transporter-associated surface protein [Kibdelosporangium persicum]
MPALANEGHAPVPPQRQLLATGHADLVSVFLGSGTLTVAGQSDVDRKATRFDPARTTVNVTDAALRPAPGSPAYDFLGVPAGTPIHVIPQTFQPGVLWAGWNTEAIPRGALAGDSVDITLNQARGPGLVEVYLTGLDGPERVWSSRNPGPRTLRTAVPTHAHANWAFTAPGVYELEFVASATAASGAPLVSAPVRYVIVVGPLAAAPTRTTLDVAETVGGLRLTGRVSGGPAHLDGGVPTGWMEFHRHYADRDDVVDHVAVDGGSAVLPVPDEPDALGYTARFVPAFHDLVAPSESPTVANPRAPPGAIVVGVRDRYTAGDTITATALVTPAQPDHTISWWTRKGSTTTPRGTTGVLTITATTDLDGAELGYDLIDTKGNAVASARAVPLRVSPAPPPTSTSPTTGPTVGPSTTTTSGPGAPPTTTTEPCVATEVTRTVRPGEVEVVTDGHFDYGPVIEGGTLTARVKDDRQGTPTWRDPSGYVFHLTDTARTTPPAGSGYDFLGSGPVWTIPLTQRPGIPWIGWNTQHPSVLGAVTGDVTMTLESVNGPGKLAVYGQDPFGGVGDRYFGTVEGFPRSTAIPAGRSGVHVHGVWAFTAPGSYSVTFAFTTTANGRPLTTKSTLAFHIGPGDPAAARPASTVVDQVGRTPSGQECALGTRGLADTGASGDVLFGLIVAATLLIPLGLLLTNVATLAAARRRR